MIVASKAQWAGILLGRTMATGEAEERGRAIEQGLCERERERERERENDWSRMKSSTGQD